MYKKMTFYVFNCILNRYMTLFGCLAISSTVLGQRGIDLHINNRVILNNDGYVIHADVAKENPKRKSNDQSFYYWYAANDIKKTRGGYDGKLLHGSYTEFYPNKNLKTQGGFKNGIKSGKWKTWYMNGQLNEILQWNKKGTVAKFEIFDEHGDLVRTGTYKNEKYDGIINEIVAGKVAKRKFREGIEIIPVKKPTADASHVKSGDRNWLGLKKKKKTKRDSVGNVKTPKTNKQPKKEKKTKESKVGTITPETQPSNSEKKKNKKKGKTAVEKAPPVK
jgi:hypothetical protein